MGLIFYPWLVIFYVNHDVGSYISAIKGLRPVKTKQWRNLVVAATDFLLHLV